MGKKLKKMLLAALLVAGVFLPAGKAEAAKASTELPSSMRQAVYQYESCNVLKYGITLPKGTVTNVKSSKPSVAGIKYARDTYGGKTYHKVIVTLKKAGKTTLSFKAAGKKFSCSLTVYKYKPAFKSLKFGSRDCTARAKRANDDIVSVSGKKKVKVSGKLNSGWKTLKFYHIPKGGRTKSIRNGGTATVKDGDRIVVSAYNKKQKKTEYFTVEYI